MPQPSDYVHLHNHTQFSLLDGLTRIPDLVGFVKDSGMEAVAMTDHGTLSGAIEFYKEATAKGIKPLVGIETYVAARKHTDKDPQKDKQRFHLIVWQFAFHVIQSLDDFAAFLLRDNRERARASRDLGHGAERNQAAGGRPDVQEVRCGRVA